MEAKFVQYNDNETTFIVKEINEVTANTIRRMIITEVPTLAIDEVNFIVNDSALYDEIIAHRLALIPLKTDLKSFEIKEKCTCKGKGCGKCEVGVTLKVKGPTTIMSSELKFKDTSVVPAFGNIPITLLTDNQALELEGKAIFGIGKQHAKFIPAIIYYRSYPEIKIDNTKITNAEAYKNVCPKDVFGVEDKKLIIKNLLNCDLCNACVDICNDNSLEVKGKENEFIFYIESFCQLNPKEILEESFKRFDAKLNEFSEKLKESDGSKLSKVKAKIKKKKV